jgi:restriction endonuclease S subunit
MHTNNQDSPNATDVFKLCDIADIRIGHPFRGTIQAHDNGDVHVIQVRDAGVSGQINQNGMIKTTLSTKKQPDWLQNGDVLFVAKGAKHHSTLVENSLVKNIGERILCSPHFFVVRVKPEFKETILPEFLCWQLNQIPAQRYFKATAEGSMYLSIRRQVLEDVSIRVLSLEKQTQLTAMHRCSVKEQTALQRLIENRQQQLDAIALNELNTF